MTLLDNLQHTHWYPKAVAQSGIDRRSEGVKG